jgi:hypothetical protein
MLTHGLLVELTGTLGCLKSMSDKAYGRLEKNKRLSVKNNGKVFNQIKTAWLVMGMRNL